MGVRRLFNYVTGNDYQDYDEYDDEYDGEYNEYEDEYDYDEYDEYEEESNRVDSFTYKNKRHDSDVVHLNKNDNVQVVLTSPADIDEACSVLDYVRQNKIVVVNLENLDGTEAQRIVDFLSGGMYALNGSLKSASKENDGVLLALSQSVDVTSDAVKATNNIFENLGKY